MLAAIQKDLDVRFHDPEAKQVYIQLAHTQNEQAIKEWEGEIHSLYPDVPLYISPLSLSISCHIGPGALAITCTKKLEI